MPVPNTTRPTRRSVLLGAVPTLGVIGLTACAAAPRPANLGDPSGDTALAEALAPHLDGHRRVSAVLIEDGSPRFAGFGADEHRVFEIGSVSKTFTGALLMDAIGRGEISLETTVGEVLADSSGGEDPAGSEIADVTMAELASHTSGLPRLPRSLVLASLPDNLLRKDPYLGQSSADVIEAALASSPSDRGTRQYSNFGVALLGQLVSRATGSSWEDLVVERINLPLGMTETTTPITADALPEDAPTGHNSQGLGAAAWTLDGYAPAGGIRSTGADMALYLAAMIDGSNPGADGLEPLTEEDENGRSSAVTWSLAPKGPSGSPITWHNGMTGGFASFCGWAPETGRGVVLLSDTARALDDLALDILDGTVTA